MHKLEFEAIYLTTFIFQAAAQQRSVNDEAGTSVSASFHIMQSILNPFKHGKEKVAFNFRVLVALATMYGVFTK